MAEVDIHTMRCDRCGEPIELVGFYFRHLVDDATTCGKGPGAARPQLLEVQYLRFSNGSESYSVVHEGVEWVLWLHAREFGQRDVWSAWRVEVGPPATGDRRLLVPQLTLYDAGPGRRHVTDARELLAKMPPLVAHWLSDKVYPF